MCPEHNLLAGLRRMQLILQLLSAALSKSELQRKTACPSAFGLLFSIERRAVLCQTRTPGSVVP